MAEPATQAIEPETPPAQEGQDDPKGEETQQQSGTPPEKDRGNEDIDELKRKVAGLEQAVSAERKKRHIAEQTFSQQQQDEGDDQFMTRAEFQAELRKHQSETERQKEDQQFQDRLSTGQEKHKDVNLSEIAGDPTLPVSEAMADELRASENPADLLVYLHKNRSEAQRLFNLPPRQLSREIARLEVQMSKPAEAPAVSSAPEPIEPVGDGGSGSISYRDDMSVADYERWAKQQRGGSVWPK